MSRKTEIRDKIYNWTKELIRIIDGLGREYSSQVISKQLLRSGTSVAANYVEAQSASSRKDFINFLHYSLKSANESGFWLKLLQDTGKAKTEEICSLQNELEEISNILGASLLTLKGERKKS